MKTFFWNGVQSSNVKITDNMVLYKWLEDNKYIHNGEIHITEQTLKELQDVELPKSESVFVGKLIFHLEYNFGAYIFIEKEDIYCCEDKFCINDGMCPY